MRYILTTLRGRLYLVAFHAAIVLAAATSLRGVARAEDNPWAAVPSPSQGTSAAIGGYSAGCLRGAVSLPLRGNGFRVMRPERNRRFGHAILIQFIKDLARATVRNGGRSLAVGDLSLPRGGPAPNGHASHQSGLDVDIGYGPAGTKDAFAALVDPEQRTVNRRWGPRVLNLLRRAATDPRVARVFVHPVIKQAACTATQTWSEDKRTWLRRLRPWWGHDDHFHVRLECPADDVECIAQDAIPDNDGCAELAWWMDPARAEERARERANYQGRVGTRPELPASCAAVLDAL